jgi:hypothetical protein
MDERNAVSDDALDRELQQVLRAEPAADLNARIRQRVAGETMGPRWWMPTWAYVGGAVVTATAAVMLMLVSPKSRAPAVAPTLIAARRLAPAPAAAPAVMSDPSGARTDAVSGFSRTGATAVAESALSRTVAAELPPVLVPPGQERAVMMFAAAAWQQRVQSPASDDAETPLKLAPIELAPVDIEPLPQMAALEGERP